MGGLAFGTRPDSPYIPRMSPAVYGRVRDACHAQLRELFVYVATPIEGPAKKDYGDLDVLVCLEKRLAFPRTPADATPTTPHDLMGIIKNKLDAKRMIKTLTATSAHLAIPWPRGLGQDLDGDDKMAGDDEMNNAHRGNSSDGATKERYVQVDVRVCGNLDELCWDLYKHAHGDIWNLIGSTIRPFGLTVDEDALWLRIPEIEKFDRKRAKVMLSQDPVEILHFLGMRVEGFWTEPFPSVDALFEYVATCRLFWVRQADDDTDIEAGVLGGEEGKRKLKANDRRRMKGRPIYRQWIGEYIPRLRATGGFTTKGNHQTIFQLRANLRDDAFAWFHIESVYNRRLQDWRLQRSIEEVKGMMKKLVPELENNQYRACVIAALRRVILEDNVTLGIVPPQPLRDSVGVYDLQAVEDFITKTWEKLGEAAWSLHKAHYHEHMRLKHAEDAERA